MLPPLSRGFHVPLNDERPLTDAMPVLRLSYPLTHTSSILTAYPEPIYLRPRPVLNCPRGHECRHTLARLTASLPSRVR